MEELPKGKLSPSDYRDHVEKAKTFKGSDLEYCRQHGLDKSRFSYHKKVSKRKSKRDVAGARFAKVNLSDEKTIKPTAVVSRLSFPDPVWLAVFLKELSRKS